MTGVPMSKTSITAILTVYNEEQRIEHALKSAAWCDEIVVLDKNSTDRTREIAARYTDKIVLFSDREFSTGQTAAWMPHASGEWVITLTASDVVHPGLARRIKELISDEAFPYDVIHIPFRRYVLGLETPRSPWYTALNSHLVFRKSTVRVDESSVHGAVGFDTLRHYKLPDSQEHCMYHLTHSGVDGMMERHAMYCRAEGRLFLSDKPLSRPFIDVFRALFVVLFKRRSFMMGWDGVALAMAYLSYWMLRFVYIWEKRRSKAPEAYAKIRADIGRAWAEEAAKKDK